MRDDSPVTMRATFYGGPADGGELLLTEPIPETLRFPMNLPELLATLVPRDAGGLLVPNNVPATYRLALDRPDTPHRDPAGRVLYRYVPAAINNPTPKEDHA